MLCMFLCEWMAQTNGFIYYTHTEAFVMLAVFSSAASIYEYMNKQSLELLWESLYEQFTISFEKTYHHIIYKQKLKRSSPQPVKIKVQFNLKKLWQKYN